MKIRLLISYKGTDFFGWQNQKNKRTVQSEIEMALKKFFCKDVSVVGSGRTDAGVHALGQTAHFEIEDRFKIRLKNANSLPALNHFLPKDISILEARQAPDDFHARFSAKKKTYQYFIFVSEVPSALFGEHIWRIPQEISFQKLQKMSQVFKGTKDFKSFQNSGSGIKPTVKTIYISKWLKVSSSLYCYEVTGSGFLKQMVRNMVGSQIGLLKIKNPVKTLENILKSKDRDRALAAAPAKGLYLKKVFYGSALDRRCPSL